MKKHSPNKVKACSGQRNARINPDFLIGQDVELITVAAPDLGLMRADQGQIEATRIALCSSA